MRAASRAAVEVRRTERRKGSVMGVGVALDWDSEAFMALVRRLRRGRERTERGEEGTCKRKRRRKKGGLSVLNLTETSGSAMLHPPFNFSVVST